MKLKKKLVLFIMILVCSVYFTVQKVTEESLLISQYLKRNKAPKKPFVIPKGTKSFDLKLIIFRNTFHPMSMISREFNVKAVLNKMDLQLVLDNKKKFIDTRVWWNDFTFIDGRPILLYDELNSIKSLSLKKIVAEFFPKMMNQVNLKSLSFFSQRCVYALKGKYMATKKTYKDLDGKNLKDEYQLYSFCFPKEGDIQNLIEFKKYFDRSYSNFMINIVDNLSDLQHFGPEDPKRMIYYTTDFDYFGNKKANGDFLTGYGRVNKDGVLFTISRVIKF